MRNMITTKERVEQFKRDCRSYNFYKKKVKECEEHIEELDVRLNGVSCPNGNTNPKTGGCGTHPSLVEIIMRQDEWKNEKIIAEYHLKKIDDVLNKIQNETDRRIIKDMYIDNKYYPTLAEKYHYSDKSHLVRRANKIVAKIV